MGLYALVRRAAINYTILWVALPRYKEEEKIAQRKKAVNRGTVALTAVAVLASAGRTMVRVLPGPTVTECWIGVRGSKSILGRGRRRRLAAALAATADPPSTSTSAPSSSQTTRGPPPEWNADGWGT